MITMEEKTRQRKAKFTERELSVLVDEIEGNYQIISAKFTDAVTNDKKNKVWIAITNNVNAVSCVQRTVDEIRRKWDDLKSRTKKKANDVKKDRQKTGGGEREEPDLTEFEQRVINLIGTTVVYGLKGGIDTDDATVSVSTEQINRSVDEDEDDDFFDSVTTVSDFTLSRPSTSNVGSQPKRQKISGEQSDRIDRHNKIHYSQKLLDVEMERLAIEKKRLAIEERRLQIEEARLLLQEKKIKMLETKFELDMTGHLNSDY